MDIFLHGVARIKAKASSSPIVWTSGPGLSHTQDIEFLGRNGNILGKITLFLESADAAIPFGDVSGLVREEPILIED